MLQLMKIVVVPCYHFLHIFGGKTKPPKKCGTFLSAKNDLTLFQLPANQK